MESEGNRNRGFNELPDLAGFNERSYRRTIIEKRRKLKGERETVERAPRREKTNAEKTDRTVKLVTREE